VRVMSRAAGQSRRGPAIAVTAPTAPAAPPAAPVTDASGDVFPLLGVYDFGTSGNRFGGGRNHQGQDILADCGTPVRAARAGHVETAKWHSAAGHFVVIAAADGTSQVYMHLLEAAALRPGDEVAAGDTLALVGQTGRATACHLHFELWTAPGWYQGGSPIDPLPMLQSTSSA
jgi:murein DD-endopeptidase MepM/ murein hydrolase activator NlpD